MSNANKRKNIRRSNKHHSNKRKKKKLKKVVLIVLLIVIIIIILGAFNFYKLYSNGGINIYKRYNNIQKEVNITVQEGSSAKNIADSLEKYDIIDSSFLFILKCKKLDIADTFKSGDFTLNTGMSFEEIVTTLQNPQQTNQLKLLVKEGQTQSDIAYSVEELGIASYDEFMQVCNEIDFDYSFLKNIPDRESRLDGYLYPDTYFVSEHETAESIINKMLTRFDEIYTSDMEKRAEQLGFTTDEIITMASIIEKEIRYPDERKIAASVIYNRLEQGIKLQMDSTVLYAKKEHTDRTLISDTKIESPYNTYYVDGLPLGPISNPSIACIEAVLNPANTDYLYYVVQDDITGQHFFTSSYEEFLSAKERYVSKFNN